MMIPFHDIWERSEFLHARYSQYEAQKNIAKRNLETYENVILMEPDNDTLCDLCNSEIDTPQVILVDYGTRAFCAECFNKHYASKPQKYKTLNPDGTLSAKVFDSADT